MKTDDFVALRLQKICKEKNINCYQLARRAGLSTSSLYSILNGKASPRVSTLEIICEALDMTICEFFWDRYALVDREKPNQETMGLSEKNYQLWMEIGKLLLNSQSDMM